MTDPIPARRIQLLTEAPKPTAAMLRLEGAIELEPKLRELVTVRASQINGCAYCVDLHAADLRKKGDTERRLYALPVWREAPFFTPRERAALAWTEALTLLPQTHAPDADFAAVREQFSERELVDLTLAIGTINTWNRLSVGFRKTLPS